MGEPLGHPDFPHERHSGHSSRPGAARSTDIKTDDESTRSAEAERRSGAMVESMRYETFVISACDSSHI